MQWANFLAKEAATHSLSLQQTAAFVECFQTEHLGKSEAKLASELNVDIAVFKKLLDEVYNKFVQNYPELIISNSRDKLQKLQSYLTAKYNSELNILKPLAAMKLLKTLVARERLQKEPWIARRICKFLGYLPLALELVGQYLDKMPGLSLETLLKRLEKKRVEHENVVNENSLMPDKDGVVEAFELSWEQLDENAKSFGCLLSLCALADIPLSIGTVEDDKKQELWEKAIADLLELHLLQQKSQGIYHLNPTIRQLFQMKLEESGEADEAKTKFAAMMLEVAKLIPQQLTPEDIVNFIPHIPHITEVATHLSQYVSDENLITLFTKLAWFYQGQGLYQQAEPWLQQCVELTKNRLGLEHLDVATSLNNLAQLYDFTGRYSEAEPLYQQALELRKRLLGEEHTDVATTLSYLALLYESTGRYKEAEPLYQQALKLWKRLVGEEHPHVATTLNNLAALYCYTGRYSKAEPLLKKSLELRKRLLGDNHLDVATSLNNLAQLYESTRRYSKAEPLYKQALELSKRLLGEEHPDVAISLNNIASLYRQTRRYKKAKPLFEQALKICERTLGVGHPTTMTIRANYASFLREAYR
ncbi:tetratricopeptide repeat protein [Nostoc sp. C110]|uniref:tetratricopeptide repeat protein n=1 Tax=Nostoc sp. C110 TaxID=3349876 RepID=UPI00370D60DE